MREHIRLTVQPFDAPGSSAEAERVTEHLGSDDVLLYASDYPHWQFDGDQPMPSGIPERLHQKIRTANALATYPRLAASLQADGGA